MQNNINFNTNYQHGDNNVNIGNIPRVINSDLEDMFIKEIKNYLPKNSFIKIRTYLGDSECQNLALSIKKMFENAGWGTGITYEIPNQSIRNVVVWIPSSEKETKTSVIIYNWLNLNNFKPIAELVKDEIGYVIYVGQNV